MLKECQITDEALKTNNNVIAITSELKKDF